MRKDESKMKTYHNLKKADTPMVPKEIQFKELRDLTIRFTKVMHEIKIIGSYI